jgi:hypothetical protein
MCAASIQLCCNPWFVCISPARLGTSPLSRQDLTHFNRRVLAINLSWMHAQKKTQPLPFRASRATLGYRHMANVISPIIKDVNWVHREAVMNLDFWEYGPFESDSLCQGEKKKSSDPQWALRLTLNSPVILLVPSTLVRMLSWYTSLLAKSLFIGPYICLGGKKKVLDTAQKNWFLPLVLS